MNYVAAWPSKTYSIPNVTPGDYLLVRLQNGYNNWSQTKTIAAGQNLTAQDIAMVFIVQNGSI
jgi:hypothetical protein